MNKIETFRKINENEKKIIDASLSKISPNILPFLKKPLHFLYISFKNIHIKKDYPKIYIVPSDLKGLMAESIQAFNENINSAGLFFGFIKGYQFFLSLEGAEYLFKEGVFPQNKQIEANVEGEKSILYGNHITKTMISKIIPSIKKNDVVLVFNQKNELIAIAYSQLDYSDFETLNSKDIVALNLIDKGYYLRKEQ